jgi:hypothetical protein
LYVFHYPVHSQNVTTFPRLLTSRYDQSSSHKLTHHCIRTSFASLLLLFEGAFSKFAIMMLGIASFLAALALDSAEGPHKTVLMPVPGTPCQNFCDDAASLGCQACCRTVTHEIDWECGATASSPGTASCCDGAWEPECWNVASAANHNHACNQCISVDEIVVCSSRTSTSTTTTTTTTEEPAEPGEQWIAVYGLCWGCIFWDDEN